MLSNMAMEILQRNYARDVETPEIQIHILDRNAVCFHTHTSVSIRRLLGFRRPTIEPLQCLLPPP